MIDADRAEIQRVIRNFMLVTDLRRETRNWPLEWFDYALERAYTYGGYQVAMHGPQLPDGLATLREERRQELQRRDDAALLTQQNAVLRNQISQLETKLEQANSLAASRAEQNALSSKSQFDKSSRLSLWNTILGAVLGGALTLFLTTCT